MVSFSTEKPVLQTHRNLKIHDTLVLLCELHARHRFNTFPLVAGPCGQQVAE